MVDITRDVYLLLKKLAAVQLQFPDTKAVLPVITLCEVSNTGDFYIDGKEITSQITIQIDVWDKKPEKSKELSKKVDEIMAKNRYQRTLGRSFKDENGLYRTMMYYKLQTINF